MADRLARRSGSRSGGAPATVRPPWRARRRGAGRRHRRHQAGRRAASTTTGALLDRRTGARRRPTATPRRCSRALAGAGRRRCGGGDEVVRAGSAAAGRWRPAASGVAAQHPGLARASRSRARLAELTGLPVYVDNDAKALALGEGWVGRGRGRARLHRHGRVDRRRRRHRARRPAARRRRAATPATSATSSSSPTAARAGAAAAAASRPRRRAPASRPSPAGRRPRPRRPRCGARTGTLVGRAVASVANLLDLRLAVVAGSVALGFGDAVLRRRPGRARPPLPARVLPRRPHRARRPRRRRAARRRGRRGLARRGRRRRRPLTGAGRASGGVPPSVDSGRGRRRGRPRRGGCEPRSWPCARHPSLWATAVRQALRLAAPGWWRRRPFLPLPAPDYLRFRLQTAYGGTGDARARARRPRHLPALVPRPARPDRRRPTLPRPVGGVRRGPRVGIWRATRGTRTGPSQCADRSHVGACSVAAMSRALVLNATYEPLCVVSDRRAVVLVLGEKAEISTPATRSCTPAHLVMPVPSVVRLRRFVRVPYRGRAPLNRRAVFARDGHRCQYCDGPAESIDHVVPAQPGRRSTRGTTSSPPAGRATCASAIACWPRRRCRCGTRRPSRGARAGSRSRWASCPTRGRRTCRSRRDARGPARPAWRVERRRGSAADLHAAPVPDGPVRAAWVLEAERAGAGAGVDPGARPGRRAVARRRAA